MRRHLISEPWATGRRHAPVSMHVNAGAAQLTSNWEWGGQLWLKVTRLSVTGDPRVFIAVESLPVGASVWVRCEVVIPSPASGIALQLGDNSIQTKALPVGVSRRVGGPHVVPATLGSRVGVRPAGIWDAGTDMLIRKVEVWVFAQPASLWSGRLDT